MTNQNDDDIRAKEAKAWRLIAEKMDAMGAGDKMVGEVLTEEEVRKIYAEVGLAEDQEI